MVVESMCEDDLYFGIYCCGCGKELRSIESSLFECEMLRKRERFWGS